MTHFVISDSKSEDVINMYCAAVGSLINTGKFNYIIFDNDSRILASIYVTAYRINCGIARIFYDTSVNAVIYADRACGINILRIIARLSCRIVFARFSRKRCKMRCLVRPKQISEPCIKTSVMTYFKSLRTEIIEIAVFKSYTVSAVNICA